MVLELSDEEIAFRLVELYVSEVSKGHEKRQMGLDTILNAYFYTLLRIKRKNEEMLSITEAVKKEEQLLKNEAKKFTPEKSGEEQFDFD